MLVHTIRIYQLNIAYNMEDLGYTTVMCWYLFLVDWWFLIYNEALASNDVQLFWVIKKLHKLPLHVV